MNILVTGAKGFIGSNLIRYLKNKTNHNYLNLIEMMILMD